MNQTAQVQQHRPVFRVPTTTRTRRLHGVCLVGGALLSVFSSRTAGAAGRAVLLTVQTSASERTLNLDAADCRVLARSLVLAADAAELGTVAHTHTAPHQAHHQAQAITENAA